jgi:hypothetical protein
MNHVGWDRSSDYAFDVLSEPEEMDGQRGADIRALTRALNTPSRAADVLRNGPVPGDEVRNFADVRERGRMELSKWVDSQPPTT